MNAIIDKNSTLPIKLTIRIIVKQDSDGEFSAHSPEFKSVLAGGKTKEEAVDKFKEAFQSYIGFLIKHNKPISCISEDRKLKNQIVEDIEIHQNNKILAFV